MLPDKPEHSSILIEKPHGSEIGQPNRHSSVRFLFVLMTMPVPSAFPPDCDFLTQSQPPTTQKNQPLAPHNSHKKTSQQEISLPRCTTYILPKTDSGQSEMITHLPEQHLFLPFSIAFPFHKPSPDTLLKDSVLPFPSSNHKAEV